MPAPTILATRSPGKMAEYEHILFDLRVIYMGLGSIGLGEESPEEDSLEQFPTFEENALAKARYFFERSGGRAILADDSGLMVEALGGAPGVLTKRWSARSDLSGRALDRANNEKLVREMRRAADEKGSVSRSARYVCVAAYVDRGFELTRRGEIAGEVLDEPRGSLGFGYDPHFYAPELGGTFAESSLEKIAKHSHRSRAVRALIAVLHAQGRAD